MNDDLPFKVCPECEFAFWLQWQKNDGSYSPGYCPNCSEEMEYDEGALN